MPKWRLVVEYEGTRYRGWQEQKNARTVQGELRKAAENYLGTEVELIGSGRTDAGVHALYQVAHLRSARTAPPATLRYELNDRLPADICVRRVDEVQPRFHARHHAEERFYLYQISTSRSAFGKHFVWWIKDRLNAEAMSEAAHLFAGRHDFAEYREKEEASSTIVEVTHVDLSRYQDMILFRIGASHFLWKMVRRITGVLVEVGRGRLSPRQVMSLRSADIAPLTAPPSGLFLEYVRYQGEGPPGPLVPALLFRRPGEK